MRDGSCTHGSHVGVLTPLVWQDHIVIAPDIHHGDPCIKGTRIPVSIILGSLADGMTPEQIYDAYPQLKRQLTPGTD